MLHHPILTDHLRLQPLPHEADAPLHGGAHVGGLDGLELEHGGAAEHRVVNIEIGILGGGCDQRDLAVLHELQQGLLLLFVEVLDLVQVEEHPVGGQHGADVLDDVLDVGDGGSCGVQTVQRPVGAPGNDVGHGGLAGARGTVEHQVGDGAAVDNPAQQAVPPQDMALAHHLIQGLGPDLVGQGPVGHVGRLLPQAKKWSGIPSAPLILT